MRCGCGLFSLLGFAAVLLVGAVILALILGIPTLRLRADYLAIVTIAAAEIVRLLLRSVTFKEFFGGSDGQNHFSSGFFALSPLPDDLVLRILSKAGGA